MDPKYGFNAVERKIQQRWAKQDCFTVNDDDPRPKYYSLCMWPYPSGDLHVGHLRNYAIGDVWARHKRMLGFNVLQPMGWDAFGKDAELKANKLGVHPAKWVKQNTANMRRELKELGFMIDWNRELNASNLKYYRWEQLLFVRMWEQNLVYYEPTKVLWDKATKTVTSRRDIDDGKVAKEDIEIKVMPAYLMRLREYANQLLDGLTQVNWPEKIIKDQQYLIGRSEGMTLHFALVGNAPVDALEVYTTRPDTICGVTYMAVAASHPLAQAAASDNPKLAKFCTQCEQTLPMDAGNPHTEKQGMPLDFTVVNPVSGKHVPVWVADYVVDDYGSGALMGVPAHDERDFKFATRYQIPIIRVINLDQQDPHRPITQAETSSGIAVNSGELDGLDLKGCVSKLEEMLGPDKARRDYGLSLRDWPINRHMYWGTPIPIVICSDCGRVPVPEHQLPVSLPNDFKHGPQALADHPDFAFCPCPRCGAKARRETDTMDTFVNSAWYFARFTCPDNSTQMIDNRAKRWLPCDHYFGGDEHAQGHLVYARFIHKVLRDLGLYPKGCGDEPFQALLCQGMVLGADGKKMSKSQDNTIMAKHILDCYGADTARLYIIGMGNPKDAYPWNEEHVKDHAMFLQNLWQLALKRRDQIAAGKEQKLAPELQLNLNKILNNIDRNLRDQHLNNLVFGGIHSIRNLIRDNADSAAMQYQGFMHLLKVMNLICPHIAEELWQQLGFEGLVIDSAWWPALTDADLHSATTVFVVQVNGKRRDQFEAPFDTDATELLELAQQRPNIARYISGKQIAKSKVIRQGNSHGLIFFALR